MKQNIDWKTPTGAALLSFLSTSKRFSRGFLSFLSKTLNIPISLLKNMRYSLRNKKTKQTIRNIIEHKRPEIIPPSVKTRILAKMIANLPNSPRLKALSAIGIKEFRTYDNLYDYFSYHYYKESPEQIHQRVNSVINSPEKLKRLFKCSPSWVVKLLNESGIRLYANVVSKKDVNEAYANVFLHLVADAMAHVGERLVLNLDETSVRISLHPRIAFNFKDKSQRIKSTVKDSKTCFTAVCIIGADGTRYDPIIIAKGKTENAGKAIDQLIKEGFRITKYVNKNGWMNPDTMLKTLDYVNSLRDQSKKNLPIYLVLDVFRAHINVEVKQKAKKLNIKLITVPANGTAIYQALDVGIFGVFKKFLESDYRDWLENVDISTDLTHLVKEGIQRFYNAWNKITKEHILAAWAKIPNLKMTFEEHLKQVNDNNNIYGDIRAIDAFLKSNTSSANKKLDEIAAMVKKEEELFSSIIQQNSTLENAVGTVNFGLVNHYNLNVDLTNHFKDVSQVKSNKREEDNNDNDDNDDDDDIAYHEQSKLCQKFSYFLAQPQPQSRSMRNSNCTMTVRNRKNISFEGQDDYSDDCTDIFTTSRYLLHKISSNTNNAIPSISNRAYQSSESWDNNTEISSPQFFSDNQFLTNNIPINSPIDLLCSDQSMVQEVTYKPKSETKDKFSCAYGFFNIGSTTCYINAFMIVLYHSKSLKGFICSTLLKSNYNSSNSLTIQIRNLFKVYDELNCDRNYEHVYSLTSKQEILTEFLKYDEGFNNTFPPLDSQFSVFRQQDENEFITFVLNRLNEECSNSDPLKSLIFIQSTTINSKMQNCMSIYEPFYNICIMGNSTSSYSLKDLIINNLNSISESSSDIYVTRFQKLPQFLVFGINRFAIVNNNIKKNNAMIIPETYLSFNEFNSSTCKVYELYAIIVHKGSLESGHYTTYLRPIEQGEWYLFNDQKVQKADTSIFKSKTIQQNCYFIFYRLVDSVCIND